MEAKRIVGIVLAAFIVGSCVWLQIRKKRKK
jgi:hypothetical protein